MNTEELDQLEYLIIGSILNNPDHLKSHAVRADYFEDYGCYELMLKLNKLGEAKEPIILVEIAEELGMQLETLINLSYCFADKKTFRLRVEKLRTAWTMRNKIRAHVAAAVSGLESGVRPEYAAKALISNLTQVLG
jgi:hypothetical protein